MKQSKNWLIEAKNLCSEIGYEDGIDPRIIARAMDKKSGSHKSKQLAKEVRHTLSMVFVGELTDPLFEDLEVIDVTATSDNQFLNVVLGVTDPNLLVDENLILEKCKSVQGYLRSTIACTVERKHVPALKFKVVQDYQMENSDAYSKNN